MGVPLYHQCHDKVMTFGGSGGIQTYSIEMTGDYQMPQPLQQSLELKDEH